VATAVKSAHAGEFRVVAISTIEVEKGFNNRRGLGDLTELAESIKSLGLLEPLIVWEPNGKGKLRLIAGERRLAASKLAGKKDVEVKVVSLDDKGRLEALLVENLHRKDIDPLEEADGYRRLIVLGLKQKEIAAKVGRSEAHVSKRLALTGLSPLAGKLLAAGSIPIDAAIALAKHRAEHQDKAIEHVKKMYRDLANAAPYQLRELGRRAADEAKKSAMSKKKAELKKKLRAAGVTILSGAQSYSWGQPGRPWRLGAGPKNSAYSDAKHVDMTPKQHSELPCHAAAVTGGDMWNEPKVIYLCTDPTSHMSKDEATKFKQKVRDGQRDSYAEQERRRKEVREQLRAAQDARLGAIRAVLKEDREDLEELALGTVVRHAHQETVAALLDLEVGKGTYAAKVVNDYCAKSDANLRRAGAAVAIIAGENAIAQVAESQASGYYFDRADLPDAIAIAEWFKQARIELADIEVKALEKAAKK